MTRTTMLPRSTSGRLHVPHTGERAVEVGSYEIWAGGTLGPLAMPATSTILVPLTEPRVKLGSEYTIIWSLLEDFGGGGREGGRLKPLVSSKPPGAREPEDLFGRVAGGFEARLAEDRLVRDGPGDRPVLGRFTMQIPVIYW